MEEITFPQIEEQPVSWGYYRDLHTADRYKAIVDRDTGKLFSVVSKDYKLIRHEQAVEQVEDAIHKSPELGEHQVETEFYNDGGRMQRKYVFPEVTVQIENNDSVNPELQLYNSYDTTWPFIVLLGAFRLICTNGLVIGKEYLHFRKRHVFDFNKIELEQQVSTAIKRFRLQGEEWKKWRSRYVNQDSYAKVMTSMKFGKKATEEIETKIFQEAEEFENETDFPIMNMWVFFNILTWFITHKAVSLNHRVELEGRLRRAISYFDA